MDQHTRSIYLPVLSNLVISFPDSFGLIQWRSTHSLTRKSEAAKPICTATITTKAENTNVIFKSNLVLHLYLYNNLPINNVIA